MIKQNKMKKLIVISVISVAACALAACSDEVKRTPGSVYMPDMAYSRAYETYADHSDLNNKGINYNTTPVPGTISRGEELPYHLANDTTGYASSRSVTNPLPPMAPVEFAEADRLYQINCAICHGAKLNGDGPLYKGGSGPYAAKPATLVGDPNIEQLSEGTYFHVMTYGKGMMGSYASQMTRKQRWMVAQYLKAKQTEARTGVRAGTATTTSATADTTAAAPGATDTTGTN